MQSPNYLTEIVKELTQTAELIPDGEVEQLAAAILQAEKLFVAGAGRSGLMVKAFAMRLMQMGKDAYVVGETVTPNLEPNDLLIIGSGSGETRSLVPIAESARCLGGSVAVITINPESTIALLSDVVIKLPGVTKDQTNSDYKTIQPMGALFEQTLLLYGDAVILKMMQKQGMDTTTMFGRHANLE